MAKSLVNKDEYEKVINESDEIIKDAQVYMEKIMGKPHAISLLHIGRQEEWQKGVLST